MIQNLFKKILLSLILYIPVCLATGQDPKESGSGAVRYLDSVIEKVDVQKDIKFGEVINFEGIPETLLLDVYTPSGDTEIARPAILWIHGGGFRIGNDKSQKYIVEMATRFARKGYVCIAINYRVRNNPKEDKTGTMTQALEDAMSGLNWLRKNSETYRVDKNRIIVGGGSAGGMLATNLCYKDGSSSEKWDKSGIIAFVNLWGSPDAAYRMSEVDKNDPPTIIVHGTADTTVPFANSEQLMKELERNKVKAELVPIIGAAHTPAEHMDEFAEKIAHFLYALL